MHGEDLAITCHFFNHAFPTVASQQLVSSRLGHYDLAMSTVAHTLLEMFVPGDNRVESTALRHVW